MFDISADLPGLYVDTILDPLSRGEGVACFLATDDGGAAPNVVYFTHTLSGVSRQYAYHKADRVRAAQAIAVQNVARKKARAEGYMPVIA